MSVSPGRWPLAALLPVFWPFVSLPGCWALLDLPTLAVSPDAATTIDAASGLDASASHDGSTDLDAGDAGTVDAGPPFLDDFERPNGVVGNDWLLKTVDTFSLATGRLVPQPLDYKRGLLYRPAIEDVLDVEVSLEALYDQVPPPTPTNDVQVYARVQASSVVADDVIDAYMAWIDNGANLRLGRHRGVFLGVLDQALLAAPVDTTHTFRVRLRVTGRLPVVVHGVAERLDGANWTVLADLEVLDSTTQRIESPGSVGTSTDESVTFTCDNFRRQPL